jgi:hypothetical protein
VLALVLRDDTQFRPDFVVLTLWGVVLGAVMWSIGPWTNRMIPMMWPIVGVALLTWGWVAVRRWRAQYQSVNAPRAVAVATGTESPRRAA